MKIYNKPSKPKLRVRLEFDNFADLELFAKVLDNVAYPLKAGPNTTTSDFAEGMLDRLIVAWPPLKEKI